MGRPKILRSKSKSKNFLTSEDFQEEQSRTLFVRLPHTIKDEDEIKQLFTGEFKVKIPRQSSRYCHVIFPDIESKFKNWSSVKKQLINGKKIYANHPKPVDIEKKLKEKVKRKKIRVPEPKVEPIVGKYLFVSNIPGGTKQSEIEKAFPGCITVGLLKGAVNDKRSARVKMQSTKLTLQYLNKEIPWPKIKGQKIFIHAGKKKKSKRKQANKNESGVKTETKQNSEDESSVSNANDEESENSENENEDES